MSTRRTRITVETNEIVVARRVISPVVVWCPKCAAQAGLVTLKQAALIRHVNESTIQDWIQSGQLHMVESHEAELMICVTSLGRHQ